MKVLVTGAGGPATDLIWQNWRIKYDLVFADQNPNRIHPIVPKARVVKLPSVDSPNFYDEIKELVLKMKIEFIVSQIDEELLLLKQLEKEVGFLKIIAPSEEFIALCLDKLKLGTFLKLKDMHEPDTKPIEANVNSEEFPYILKPRFGRGSRGIFVVNKFSEFELLRKYLISREISYISQRYIEGAEYTIQMISSETGNLHAIAALRVGEKRGSTMSAVIENEQVIIETCQQLHLILKGSGTYNIQLIYLPNKKQCLVFEINPRVSTTMCVALQSGVDPIEVFLSKTSPSTPIKLRDGTKLERFTANIIDLEE